ncbi:MAG: phage tail tape measure protein [Zoogloeaceae bacterium]|jgi:hypothetical protein|nr:phage tail tape measure protein [Zoogloeaceae bacterium]
MSGNIDVGISLRLNNSASAALRRANEEAARGARQTANATARASNQAAQAAERGAAMQRNSYQRLTQARERLGVRSEHAIQREIDRTRAAYQRLAQSGSMTWREQTRAASAMRAQVSALTNEMGKLTARQKAMGAMKGGMAIAGGAAAAGYVLKDPIQKAIDFDYRLAGMANTAFAERDTVGRKAGMKELEAAVNSAVKQGGGSRDSAAEALDSLIASGAVSSGDAIRMLPELMKASTASSADATELANIGIRAMQSFGVSASELPNMLNMAISAGQAGGFELRDMARWLPQQLAAAKMSGMSGRGDFAAIAALNQAGAITAGTKDEAGNNVANLLRKINSQDTAADVKKVMGIDLAKYLQESRGKGINSIDAFGALMTKSVEKDPRYRALQTQLANAGNDDERRTTLESMSAIAQGSGIGKIIQDQQGMMALIAMQNNQGYMQDVRRQVLANDVAAGGAIDQNFALMEETTGYKLRMAAELKDMAQKEALDALTPTIGKAAEAFSDLTNSHGALVGATTLATGALTAFAGVAGAAALAMGGKSAVGAAASVAAKAGPAAAVAASGAAGYAAGTYIVNPILNKGAQLISGDERATLGTWFSDLMNKDEEDPLLKSVTPPEQKPVDVNTQISIQLDKGLLVQSQNTQVTGGAAVVNTGNIMSGAPG